MKLIQNAFVPSSDTQSEHAEIRSEDVIHASELSYRRLFETARDGILILDADTGRIRDVNPFIVSLLGFSHGEMVGKTIGELSPFKDIESNKVMLERLQKNGYVRYDDLPLETSDGRQIAVEFVSNIYKAGSRTVVQCNVRDITERKKAEAILIRLASIVECSDDAIIGKDQNGIITNWNKGAEKLLGYAAAEIVGTSILRLIPGDLLHEEQQILEKARQGQRVEHFETLRMAKDGRLIDVSVTISVIKDASGNIMSVSKVAHNITARKAAEDKVLQLNLELERRVVERTAELLSANQELEAFSYSVSHDLRAPLRHVTGFVTLLRNSAGPALSEENLGLLTDISEAATRMAALIDDLLAFSRVGKLEMRKTHVNLDSLIRETLGDFRAETQHRKIDWHIGPLPIAWADRALLRMALVNLISNAVKFTGARALARIEIGCVPSGDLEDVIFIRDNGAGFDPLYADKLFGVFQRLHDREEFDGTGIGLANVQRIILRHGGRAWAKGEVENGATFFLSLPKQKEAIHGH